MIEIANAYECCGCNGCVQICPKSCITMVDDREGFWYPKVDKSKCIECQLCKKVCPIIQEKHHLKETNTEQKQTLAVYGGWHKNSEIRRLSSSGGVFTLLAEYILSQDGIVFGARTDKNLKVSHIGITNTKDLNKLRRSKYVQSDIGQTYTAVKNALIKGQLVLFVGAPCQTAGLQCFLNKDYSNLYTCDFICHGVPSPLVFSKYVNYLEKKNKDSIIGFSFRNKHKGWNQIGLQMGTVVKFRSGQFKEYMPAYRDYFMSGFLSDIYLRPACYKCMFKSKDKRHADITMADFWGVKKYYPELDDKNGTSLLLLNSTKAEELFKHVKDNFHYKECEFDKALERNPSLWKSAKEPKRRIQFYTDLEQYPFQYVMIKHMTGLRWLIEKVFGMLQTKLRKG
ncbi:MAG: hypothetical protein BEN18_02205 [Epulopiscium sp. Nuni2H_MBin001]|nr:MAG: hypothetical protein BEN18_02205 [Epulopiscium sp. Nuni2H_MBin001]